MGSWHRTRDSIRTGSGSSTSTAPAPHLLAIRNEVTHEQLDSADSSNTSSPYPCSARLTPRPHWFRPAWSTSGSTALAWPTWNGWRESGPRAPTLPTAGGAHARVDRSSGRLPDSDELDEALARVRAVTLSSERLGVIAKIDVVEVRDGVVMPVDFKKGKRPHVAAGAYEPERAQVCVQAMILEDNGYTVKNGALWYVGSREKVRVALDEDLRARTLEAIRGLRAAAEARRRPPPLEDSPKCPRCSLAGICLPDETNPLPERPSSPAPEPVRRSGPAAPCPGAGREAPQVRGHARR